MPAPHPASGLPFPPAPEGSFTNGREALHGSGLTPARQAVYTLAVSGYLDVATTQIYTHVRNRPGLGLKSPLEAPDA